MLSVSKRPVSKAQAHNWEPGQKSRSQDLNKDDIAILVMVVSEYGDWSFPRGYIQWAQQSQSRSFVTLDLPIQHGDFL